MKTTFVSTQSLQTALRQQILTAQSELQKSQQEASTGIYADVGVSLGGQTKSVLNLTGAVSGMQSTIDANGLVNTRLSSAQTALGQMSDDVQTSLDALLTLASSSSADQIKTATTQVANSFQAFTSEANLSSNGEYLFAGINTASQPLTQYGDGSAAKQDFENQFEEYFSFPFGDAQMSTIDGDAMKGFLTSYRGSLDGSAWSDNWSSASDTVMTSRISDNETVQTSSTANTSGVKDMAFAAVISSELLGSNISSDARGAVVTAATSSLGSSISGLNQMQSDLGISQARVKSANSSLQDRMDIANTQLNNLEAVDPYEAATKVNSLLTQLETSYTLTGRMQQLSLVDYL